MKKADKIYLVYLAIIMLQILNMIYWANVKTNYYIDELYSMGYASSYTGAEDTATYITTSKDWKWNEWTRNAEFKKYLWVSDREEIFRLPFTQAIVKLASSRNYMGFLNLAESLGGYRFVTKWPGILLNIFIFIVAELVLIILSVRLKMSKWSTGLLLAMFGFCGYFIGLVEYIRFYMLIMLMVLIMILLHYVIWTSDKLWQIAACEIGGFAMAYLGLRNSELMLVYTGALMGCFCIALLVTKKWKKLGTYALMIFIAIIYLARRTEWLKILFNLGNYSGTSTVTEYVTTNIVNASIPQVVSYLIWLVFLLANYCFGHCRIALLWGVFFVLLVLKTVRSRNQNLLRLNHEDGFMLVLTGTLAIYTLFAALADLDSSRYYSFGVITFIIILWYVIDQMIRRARFERIVPCYGFLTVLVVMSCLAPFKTRNIEYIYEQDRELISRLQAYQGTDTILATYTEENGEISRHENYDCINLFDDETRICPIDMSEYIYDGGIFPDKFLLWAPVDRDFADITELISNLEMDGYQVEYLAADHISVAYICKKP